MFRIQRDVEDFHRAMDQVVGTSPAIRDAELRARLIMSEAAETANALLGEPIHFSIGDGEMRTKEDCRKPDLTEVVDGVCDILYVTAGTAVACGFDIFPFWKEVHRTNMAKADGPVREDGKQMKPEGWEPPRIGEMLKHVESIASARRNDHENPEPIEETYTFNLAQLRELVAQVAGAATSPFMQAQPDTVMPEHDVFEAVNKVLVSFMLPTFMLTEPDQPSFGERDGDPPVQVYYPVVDNPQA